MTTYFVIYITLINTGLLFLLVPFLYIVSPFFIIWMVTCILKENKVKHLQLKENEEWGYTDKPKDELGIL